MRNPFANDDNAGVVGMLVGLVVVVFVAIALSLVVTKEVSLPSFSGSGLRSANGELHAQASRLETGIETQKLLNAKAARHREQSGLRADLEKQAASAREEISILGKLITSKRDAIGLIAKGRESHRLKYREHVRAEALGKTYESVTTRLGKTYEDVRVTGVTPLGVSLSHRHGAVRLEYSEMPGEWQKRLMYTAREYAQAKLAEQRREAAARKAIAREVRKIRKAERNEAAERKIAGLRKQIASVSMRLATARTEASLARNKVAYQASLRRSRALARHSYRSYNPTTGTYHSRYYRPRYRISLNGRQSVPGSLETWRARAARYERAAARYAAQLGSLRASLVAADPTYRIPPEGEDQ